MTRSSQTGTKQRSDHDAGPAKAEPGVRIGFDIGGTFTDIVAYSETTRRWTSVKVLSTPANPGLGALAGLRQLFSVDGIGREAIVEILHATTVATNAILERNGGLTCLITTKGFRDVLGLGRQKRYNTFDMRLQRPEPLVKRSDIFEISERTGHDGLIINAVDGEELDRLIDEIVERRYESVAICLLHAYANSDNEQAIETAIRVRAPQLFITCSSALSPRIREYERTSTTVADAYVKPRVARYVAELSKKLSDEGLSSDLKIMQSNGGLVPAAVAVQTPIRIVESGPAAGVLMAAEVGRHEGLSHILSFDMGGTTAKLGAVDNGAPAIMTTFEVDRKNYRPHSGLPLNIESVELLEIGAGGGSIGSVKHGILSVGPQSAGSDPGPICYGLGGRLPTVTDANLVLGYLNPDYFNGGRIQLDREAAERGIEDYIGKPLALSAVNGAWGIHSMANNRMEAATRVVSIERGRDPRRYALVAFGGAGPLHAAQIARALNVPKVIVPAGAGLGSAIGLLSANFVLDVSMTKSAPLATGCAELASEVYATLERRAQQAIDRVQPGSQAVLSRSASMRFVGQGFEVRVQLPMSAFAEDFVTFAADAFRARYGSIYGYVNPKTGIEIVDWHLTLTMSRASKPVSPALSLAAGHSVSAHEMRLAYCPHKQAMREFRVIRRDRIGTMETVIGPAIIEEPECTTVLHQGDAAHVSALGHLTIDIQARGRA